MVGIIISITEEELQAKLENAICSALNAHKPESEQTVYMTRKEVAALLHVSFPTLNDYTKKGKLLAYRINGRVLYKKNEIEEALNAVEPLKYRR